MKTPVPDVSPDELRTMAARAGLSLSEEELQRLLPGVNRARAQVAELRGLITDDSEPAGTFKATGPAGGNRNG